MNSAPAPKRNSPFAARASTRAPVSPPAASAVPLAEGGAERKAARKAGGALVAAVVAFFALIAVGAWWMMRADRPGLSPVAAASADVSAPTKPTAPAETPSAAAKRLAKAFAAVQARAAGLALDATARATLADATLLAAGAEARAKSGDGVGAAREWERALAAAGPVVSAGVSALYEADVAALRDVRLQDQAASAVQALASASAAADEAERRGEWAEAIARRDEARGLVPVASKAVAARFADVARDAAARGDGAMATLFHERALRLDAELESSRAHLYRHKFRPGQLLRSPGGLELAYAPPVEFLRGSPAGEPGRDADEPSRRVVLTKGFFVAVNETTQRDWDRVMGPGAASSILRAAKAKPETIAPDLPMHSVTWEQAADYCRKLSEREGLRFRLPTEAEWEYACRAGTTTAFNLGVDGLSAREANIDDGSAGVSLAPRPPGASGRANAWGLRDMHGNVWEWCADWSAPYETGEAIRDPAGPAREALGRIDLAMKVVRGGGWNAPANDARSANRWEYSPAVATGYIGLRVVHDPDLVRP